jgi:hypothetical protein
LEVGIEIFYSTKISEMSLVTKLVPNLVTTNLFIFVFCQNLEINTLQLAASWKICMAHKVVAKYEIYGLVSGQI